MKTVHLYLRPTQPGDEAWIINLFTNPEVREYLGGAMSERDARAFVLIKGELWGHFAIIKNDIRLAIGSLSFTERNGTWEINYQLFPAYWGRGYAAEAIKAAIGWFFRVSGEYTVSAVTQKKNERSCRLLEKLGAKDVESFQYRGYTVARFVFSKTLK